MASSRAFKVQRAPLKTRRTRGRGRSLTAVELRIDGIDLAGSAFKNIKPALRNRITRTAVRAGARPIWQDMKNRAPTHQPKNPRARRPKSSDLKRSIKVKSVTYRRNGTTVAIVGPENKKLAGKLVMYGKYEKNPAIYAHLVELGHRIKHYPYRSKKGLGTWASVPPRPFVRPALETNKAKAFAIMRKRYREEIVKAFRKGQGRVA